MSRILRSPGQTHHKARMTADKEENAKRALWPTRAARPSLRAGRLPRLFLPPSVMADEGGKDTPEQQKRDHNSGSIRNDQERLPEPAQRPFGAIRRGSRSRLPASPFLPCWSVNTRPVPTVDFPERSLPTCMEPKDDRNGHQRNLPTDLRSREGAEKGKGVQAAAPTCSVTKATTH